jgi:hypothetical protein
VIRLLSEQISQPQPAADVAWPVPRRLGQSHAAFQPLDVLPDEVLLLIGMHALSIQLLCSQRLRAVCQRMHATLDPVKTAALERRLQWLQDGWHVTENFEVSNHGTKLTLLDQDGLADRHVAWAAGSLLPTQGTSSWKVRVIKTRGGNPFVFVGVCDAASRCKWCMRLENGGMGRYCRDADGKFEGRPPPDGFPDGRGNSRTLKDASGEIINGGGPIKKGTVIEVVFDHDQGILSFRADYGPLCEALRGFPAGAALRMYAAATLLPGDCVSLVRPYYTLM